MYLNDIVSLQWSEHCCRDTIVYTGVVAMSLEAIIYCPLMEEGVDDVTGWDKQTIAYVSKHRHKVYAQIRGIAKNTRRHNLQTSDVEDIYSEVLEYLYSCDDYNISKAVERSSTNTIVTLEGYVNACIKYCVVRHCTSMYKDEKEVIHDTIHDEDGKELSLLDNIADSKSDMDYVLYDLEAICRSCESVRYKYGVDIYQLWFVRLLTLSNDKLYKDMLDILGISRKELVQVEKKAAEDELMTTFTKAISIIGIENAIHVIRPYVYSAPKIEETISTYMK